MQSPLDQTIAELKEALSESELLKPDVLFLMATGTQHLIDHLGDPRELELDTLSAIPAPWRQTKLHTGTLGNLNVWALDDCVGDPGVLQAPDAPWSSAFPVWWAAESGAALCVHTSAGSALDAESSPGFALLSDHINLSGKSPLLGLGPSELGPLFPDPSGLHHVGLRHAALKQALLLDLVAREVVAACTSGPALETAAERRMLASLGADVSVQALAAPLIACAHAGLACLSMVSVSPAPGDSCDLELLVHQAAQAGPQLNQWILNMLPDFEQTIHTLREELLT